ncbi:TPA: winged helix-turn-helix transcriptional regulator [Candidatus Woesearchaeota archaeon]|nr:hypothetical protein QT06_C0001G0241 [archaeon GW2011_AR15]MBS3103960.1 winged helix-turn-helix transcriptional regulator [Candidatus Woesearchaeota archaeon]HIH40972.1 winged helix-turn-helix transcriptional regulator [Candidatus Woesearchaeota archaeon]
MKINQDGMENQEIIEKLFDAKLVGILKAFLKNEENEYYLRELARSAQVSPASTYRILNRLVKLELLESREIKTAKLYKLASNKKVEFIKSILEVDILDYFVDKVSKMPGVEQVLQLGKKDKIKANVILLGTTINTADVKLLAGEIKEKYGFTVNQMTLSKEQYEQMASMGLYPGEKKILFRAA